MTSGRTIGGSDKMKILPARLDMVWSPTANGSAGELLGSALTKGKLVSTWWRAAGAYHVSEGEAGMERIRERFAVSILCSACLSWKDGGLLIYSLCSY
jgi:hypothetical protein